MEESPLCASCSLPRRLSAADLADSACCCPAVMVSGCEALPSLNFRPVPRFVFGIAADILNSQVVVTNLTRTMEFLPSAFLRERKSLLGEHKPKN